MSRVRSALAAGRNRSVVVAAGTVIFLLSCGAASAADWYTGASVKPQDDWIVAIDASATAASNSSDFAGASATVAAGGTLTTSGARVRLEGLAGTYTFDANGAGAQTRGDQVEGGLLGGYEWLTGRSSIAAYGGLVVRDSRFSDVSSDHAADGTKFGVKGVLQYYGTPSDKTMLSAYASYSSIYNAYYARLKWGVAPLGAFYVGPEFAALGDDFYRQWRVGVHLTTFRIGAMQFGVSGGYAIDQNSRGGGYGSLDARILY